MTASEISNMVSAFYMLATKQHPSIEEFVEELQVFMELAAESEREACAKVAEGAVHRKDWPTCNCEFCESADEIATAIRARGDKPE